jgi:hypothetical protein
MPPTNTGFTSVKLPTALVDQAREADALLAQFMAVENDGSLAQRVREVVAKRT